MMQKTFAQALLNPDADCPPGLTDGLGRPVPKRFSVYRNNVASSLTRVLEAGFPVIRRLVGDEFFGALAVAFLRAHPPRTPLMMDYGADFAGFLADFPPVAHLAYLPDMARLEQALRQSYHATDAAPIDPQTLTDMPVDVLLGARLHLAPAFRLIRSEWPVHAIWRANMANGPPPVMKAEAVAITRTSFDPEMSLLAASSATFIAALEYSTVGQAIAQSDDELDLVATLGLLLSGAAITGVSP